MPVSALAELPGAVGSPEVSAPRADAAALFADANRARRDGNLDRADTQLDTLGHQDSQSMLGISMFRHLVRAEEAGRRLLLRELRTL